jgi:protein subunit release factor B
MLWRSCTGHEFLKTRGPLEMVLPTFMVQEEEQKRREEEDRARAQVSQVVWGRRLKRVRQSTAQTGVQHKSQMRERALKLTLGPQLHLPTDLTE